MLMKRFAVSLLLLILITACAVQATEPTPILAPTVTTTNTPYPTATETITPTPTEVRASFETPIQPSIEAAMENNYIRPEYLLEDIARFKEQLMVNIPSHEDCPTFIFEEFSSAGEGQMGLTKVTIENPKLLGTAGLKIDGKEFLFLAFPLHSLPKYGEDYCGIDIFAVDLSLNRTIPDYLKYQGEDYFNSFSSLFADEEANYKKIINGEVEKLILYTCVLTGNASFESVHKNLYWLYGFTNNLSKNQIIIDSNNYGEYVFALSTGLYGGGVGVPQEFREHASETLTNYPIGVSGLLVDPSEIR